MTEKNKFFNHVFRGGFVSDFGSDTDFLLINENTVAIPFLLTADNLIYSLDGGPRKAPGTSKLSSELQSGAVIKGIFDLWFSGTGGSSTQHRIVHVDTTIKKDDADGSFSDLFTGLQAGKVPSYAILEDLLVMASDSTTDVPKSWDGSTAQNLAGSPPNFAIVVTHGGRLFATGNAADPSRVYYTRNLNPEGWTGIGSGSFLVSPDDGDVCTGLASHKKELFMFKGPYKGSIWTLSGTSPANFVKDIFVKGIGAAGHNTIFRFKDDIGFMWSDGSVHSLSATAAHGDFVQGALSQDISEWIRDNINFSKIKNFWAVNDEEGGYILFSVAIGGSSTNNYTLMMNYKFDHPRWATWSDYASGSIASVVDPTSNNRRIIMAGGTDGFVRKYGQANRGIDGTTDVSYEWVTPFINYGSLIQVKTLEQGSLSLVRKDSSTVTLSWIRDEGSQEQTFDYTPFGKGGVLGTFVLDTDVLGGAAIIDLFAEFEEGGEFHSIQYKMKNDSQNDVDIHAFGSALSFGSWATE